ncbi:hypothetical protein EYC80_010737 [Monilinia laxa]|uniref:SAP domain-containing protein n=1 Tax=Monilinia laxa TaxID=61186 RepID=A0A5N6JQ30_MONLA|nr:hypothetical protein EYC80_010737 [Monilinia laxa]
MPSTKRTLAQANTDVILPLQKKKKAKCVPPNKDYESKTREDHLVREAQEAADAEKNDRGDCEKNKQGAPTACPSTAGVKSTSDSIYAQKDNSMLRSLLRNRNLQVSGTREEMIHRLEISPYNYESYTSEELSLILKNRDLKKTNYGSKETKIQRLKNSDEELFDRSNQKETGLYIDLDIRRWIVNVEEQVLKALGNPGTDYETLDFFVLNVLVRARALPIQGDREAVIKRFRADDEKPSSKSKDKAFMRDAIKNLTASLKKHKRACDKAKRDLENSLGHPVLDIATVMKVHKAVDKRDGEITNSYQPVHKPGPICDYDWKDSHWAKRSERELREICKRRGMKGWGTKATGIKWLETGSVEYDELSATSLQTMCMQRGIKVKSHEVRLDLARKLRETDEKEIAYWDLGIMALNKLCKERGMQVKANESKENLITRLRQADESTGRS